MTGISWAGDVRSDQLGYGIGIDGSLGSAAVIELARQAENLGYDAAWFNVTDPALRPIELLAAVLEATESIEIGVGVVPVDAHPVHEISTELVAKGVSGSRVLLGLGAGQKRQGALDLMTEAVAELRRLDLGIRLAMAAYRPRMLHLGGEIADALSLAWMNAERLAWASDIVGLAAAAAGRPAPSLYLYERVAWGDGAAERIRAETLAYRQIRVHSLHQADMGNPDMIGTVAEGDWVSRLEPLSRLARVVLKPVLSDAKDLSAWHETLHELAVRDERTEAGGEP